MQHVTDVVILSGAGRYSDPWHPFAETSAALAGIASGLGLSVEVRETLSPEALAPTDERLVIVNSGKGTSPGAPDPAWTDAFTGFSAWLGAGGRLLGVHTAAATFPDWPTWRGILGGAWTSGSSHPRLSIAGFLATAGSRRHPILWGLPDAGLLDHDLTGVPLVLAVDERYSGLEIEPGSTPLLSHQLDGRAEVMAWVTGNLIVYDGMGHDHRSYRSASRRRVVENAITWLLDD